MLVQGAANILGTLPPANIFHYTAYISVRGLERNTTFIKFYTERMDSVGSQPQNKNIKQTDYSYENDADNTERK